MRPGALAIALLLLLAPAARADVFAVPTTRDARDVPGDPLDLRAVSFGQRDTELRLTVRTEGRLAAGRLPDEGVCVSLVRRRVLAQVCAGAVLRRRTVAEDGTAGPLRAIPGAWVRRTRTSLHARFTPRAAGLGLGRLRWFAESRRSAPGRCAAGCLDRLPDAGSRALRVQVLSE